MDGKDIAFRCYAPGNLTDDERAVLQVLKDARGRGRGRMVALSDRDVANRLNDRKDGREYIVTVVVLGWLQSLEAKGAARRLKNGRWVKK